MTTAAVVGSGPNGLAAAIHLAQHGIEVTVYEMADVVGGARGFWVVCSAPLITRNN